VRPEYSFNHNIKSLPLALTVKIQLGVRNTPTEQKEVAENDSGQSLLHPVTLIGESHRNGERTKNAFWGVLGFRRAGQY
jgi:hypothetical protein